MSTVFFIAIVVFFFFSRLYNILLLPIFTDESIYIYWAKIIATEHSHWLISLTDGKPPLLIWMISLLLVVLPSDLYLLAGRLPSVAAGFITLIGIYKLTNLLFASKKAGLIASLLYVITPFTLLYDRMALFDSLLTATLIWTLYYALKTGITFKIKDALLWGFFLGFGFLSKPPAVIFLFLTPLCVLLYSSKKIIAANWKRLLALFAIVVVISEAMNNSLRISGAYPLMAIKNKQFQQPLSELIEHPFGLMSGNLMGFFSWIIAYYTLPLFIFGCLSFVFLLIKKTREGIILLLLWFMPIFIFASVGREIFPRYILFTTPYFLITLSFVIDYGLRQKLLLRIITMVIVGAIAVGPLQFDSLLLTYPPSAPMPLNDYNQYISQHPSGYGLNKVMAFLDNELKSNNVTLVTQGTFGLYPYAFKLYYWDNNRLRIIDRWPLKVIDQDIFDARKTSKVYILFKEYDSVPEDLPVNLVLKSEKPGGKFPLLLTTLK